MSDLDFILGTNSDNDFFNEVEVESSPQPGEISEEDDSNEEDNWRNDYPDEEDSENCTFLRSIDWLIDCFTDWLFDWLIDWLVYTFRFLVLADVSKSGSESGTSEDENEYCEELFGMDHSYATRRTYRSTKTIDSDNDSSDAMEKENDEDD